MVVKKQPVKNRLDNGEAAVPLSAGPASEQVVIARIEPKIVEIEIVGLTPLLVCAWSEKARRMMLRGQTGEAHKKKEKRDPHQEYLDALYLSTDGWTGIPAGGVKGALVGACRAVDGLPMTLAKRMIFIRAQGRTKDGQQLVRIHGQHEMHSGMVRLTSGVAMERFRPVYKEWSMKLEIEFLANVISAEQVANLVELAGWIEGLCEHRPGSPKSNTGDNGRFRIKRVDD